MTLSPLTLFRCMRHRRGFGIHSPFAFRFVTEVLAQRLPYYGYTDISGDPRIRLLFRLTVYFRPSTVAVFSSEPQLLCQAIHKASPGAHITNTSTPDFIVADAADFPPEAYSRLIAGGASALILNALPATRHAIASAISHGMIFDNRRSTLVVASLSHLPRQDFDVWF